MLINLNGQFVDGAAAVLPYNDSSCLYGDSLFETLRVVDGQVFWREDHLDRLQQAALQLEMPFDRPQITEELERTVRQLGMGPFRLRLTITRGALQGPTIPHGLPGSWLLAAVPFTPMSDTKRQQGYACVLAPNQRVNPLSHLPQMKRGNYADCLYARDYALQQNADEALFVDSSSHLLEGATTSLFIVEGKTLITPPLGSLVLNGVYRKQVLESAAYVGLKAKEEVVPLKRLPAADAAFLTNSIQGVVPITSLDDAAIPQNDLWRDIYAAVESGSVLTSGSKTL